MARRYLNTSEVSALGLTQKPRQYLTPDEVQGLGLDASVGQPQSPANPTLGNRVPSLTPQPMMNTGATLPQGTIPAVQYQSPVYGDPAGSEPSAISYSSPTDYHKLDPRTRETLATAPPEAYGTRFLNAFSAGLRKSHETDVPYSFGGTVVSLATLSETRNDPTFTTPRAMEAQEKRVMQNPIVQYGFSIIDDALENERMSELRGNDPEAPPFAFNKTMLSAEKLGDILGNQVPIFAATFIPTAIASYITKRPDMILSVSYASAFVLETGFAYRAARELKLNKDDSAKMAVRSGLINGALEVAPQVKLLKTLGVWGAVKKETVKALVKRSMLRKVGKVAVSAEIQSDLESITEALQEINNIWQEALAQGKNPIEELQKPENLLRTGDAAYSAKIIGYIVGTPSAVVESARESSEYNRQQSELRQQGVAMTAADRAAQVRGSIRPADVRIPLRPADPSLRGRVTPVAPPVAPQPAPVAPVEEQPAPDPRLESAFQRLRTKTAGKPAVETPVVETPIEAPQKPATKKTVKPVKVVKVDAESTQEELRGWDEWSKSHPDLDYTDYLRSLREQPATTPSAPPVAAKPLDKDAVPMTNTEFNKYIQQKAADLYREQRARGEYEDLAYDIIIYGRQVPTKIGRRFDAHGVGKGGLTSLLNFLDNGIDQSRPLFSTPLRDEDGYGTQGDPLSHSQGFMILSDIDSNLKPDGIKRVVVDGQHYELIEDLQNHYPNIEFIRADNLISRLSEIVQQSAAAKPVATPSQSEAVPTPTAEKTVPQVKEPAKGVLQPLSRIQVTKQGVGRPDGVTKEAWAQVTEEEVAERGEKFQEAQDTVEEKYRIQKLNLSEKDPIRAKQLYDSGMRDLGFDPYNPFAILADKYQPSPRPAAAEPAAKAESDRYEIRKDRYDEKRGDTGVFHERWIVWDKNKNIKASQWYSDESAATRALDKLKEIKSAPVSTPTVKESLAVAKPAPYVETIEDQIRVWAKPFGKHVGFNNTNYSAHHVDAGTGKSDIVVGIKGKTLNDAKLVTLHELGHEYHRHEGTAHENISDERLRDEVDAWQWAIDNSKDYDVSLDGLDNLVDRELKDDILKNLSFPNKKPVAAKPAAVKPSPAAKEAWDDNKRTSFINEVTSEISRTSKNRIDAVSHGKRSKSITNSQRIADKYGLKLNDVEHIVGMGMLSSLEGDVKVIKPVVEQALSNRLPDLVKPSVEAETKAKPAVQEVAAVEVTTKEKPNGSENQSGVSNQVGERETAVKAKPVKGRGRGETSPSEVLEAQKKPKRERLKKTPNQHVYEVANVELDDHAMAGEVVDALVEAGVPKERLVETVESLNAKLDAEPNLPIQSAVKETIGEDAIGLRMVNPQEINVDLPRFQGRFDPFSKESYDKIVSQGWDMVKNKTNPIVVWRDKALNQWFVLSGHSRLKAAQDMNVERIYVLDAGDISEAEARNTALESNRLSMRENTSEDVRLLNRMKEEGRTPEEIHRMFYGQELKIEAYSGLNPKGSFMEILNGEVKGKSLTNYPYLPVRAAAIGKLRNKYHHLMDNHYWNTYEQQIFNWLYSPQENNKGTAELSYKRIGRDDLYEMIEKQITDPAWTPSKGIRLSYDKPKLLQSLRHREDLIEVFKRLDTLRLEKEIAELNNDKMQIDQLTSQIALMVEKIQDKAKNQTSLFGEEDVTDDMFVSKPSPSDALAEAKARLKKFGEKGSIGIDEEGEYGYKEAIDDIKLVAGIYYDQMVRGVDNFLAKLKEGMGDKFERFEDDARRIWKTFEKDEPVKQKEEAKAKAEEKKVEAVDPDAGKVGLRQVDNVAFMKSLDKAEFDPIEREKWVEARDNALKNEKVNIDWARNKVNSILDSPDDTPYTQEDHAAVVMVVKQLQNSRYEASDRAEELRMKGDNISLIAAEVLDAQASLYAIEEENLRRGGQLGISIHARGLQAARMLDNGEEFTRAAIEKKISKATGKPVTPEQAKIAEEQAKKIEELESRLKKSEDEQATVRDRIAALEADREVARRKQQARSEGRKVKIEDIDAQIAAAKAKLKVFGREFHAGIFSDAEVKTWAEIIYLYSEKYGIKAVDAADRLISELGDPSINSKDILSAIEAVSDKHKAQRRKAAIRYRDRMKAVRELAESINPDNVKEAKKKLAKLTDDYVKVDPEDKRLVAVLRKIEKIQTALDRGEVITPYGFRKDVAVIEAAREELRELHTRMGLRRREADINRQIANGKLDTPLLRVRMPDNPEIARDRARLSLAKNRLQQIIDSQAKITKTDIVKGVMQTIRGMVFGFDLAGTMFTRGAEFTTAYPIQSTKIHARGVAGFFSEERTAKYHNDMLSHPATALFLSDDPTYVRDPNGDHTSADELFSNALLESASKRKMTRVFGIPIKFLNMGNKASNRAYALGVNGMLDVLAEDYMTRNPYANKAERLEAIKWFKNLMGRGDFKVVDPKTGKLVDGMVEKLIQGGQNIGSAPRILASNIRSPYLTIQAMFNFSNRPLQLMAIRQVGLYYGTRVAFITILMALSEAFDWDLEFTLNPYSSDFGQIKKGNTRWNVFGPMRSLARSEALLVLSAMPKGVNPFAGSSSYKSYWKQSPEMLILRTAVGNRINPPVRLGVGLVFGTNWQGKPDSRWQILRQGTTPLWSQNVYDGVYDALNSGGSFADAAGIGVLSQVGQDFNTYENRDSEIQRLNAMSSRDSAKIKQREWNAKHPEGSKIQYVFDKDTQKWVFKRDN